MCGLSTLSDSYAASRRSLAWGPFSLINPDAYTDQAHPVDKNGQDCLLDRGLGSDAVRQIRTESAPDLSSSGVRV